MKTIFIIIGCAFFAPSANAQFLKKLGDKAIDAAGRTVERKVEEKSEKTTSDTSDKVLNPKKKAKKESSEEMSSDEPKAKKIKTPKKPRK